MIALRPYQLDAVEAVRVEIRAGRARILLVAFTGAGKTVLAAHIISATRARGKRVLFVAHRRELINQTVAKLIADDVPESAIGVVMANDPRRRPGASVLVASIDTLRNRPPQLVDLIIIDEAHRSLAQSYVNLVESQRSAVVLGLTATPWRGDNRGLDLIYESLVPVAMPSALIANGFIAEPRVFSTPGPDLTNVKVTAGDYNEAQLAEVMNKRELVGNLVEHYQRHAAGLRGVAFACNVEHSRAITARFVEAGIPAEHIDGTMASSERDAILARLDRGETRVVSNCAVLTEGWDQPSVKCCLLARPTKSVSLFIQCAGRVLRPWDNVTPIVLDHAGNVRVHGLPHEDRELSLDGKKRARTSKSITYCPQCFLAVESGTRTCPECGAACSLPKESASRCEVQERSGELTEIAARSEERERRRLCLRIDTLSGQHERARRWAKSEVARRLFARFRKKRPDMSLTELSAVISYLETGFAVDHPVEKIFAQREEVRAVLARLHAPSTEMAEASW